MEENQIKEERNIRGVQSGVRFIGVFLTIVGVISAASAVYIFYIDNLWKPKVTITSFDSVNGVAEVTVNGKQMTIYYNSPVYAGGDWGVQLAGETKPDGSVVFNRIELIKKGLVNDVIYTAS